MPNRLFIAPDGLHWVVSVHARGVDRSSPLATDQTQQADYAHVVFESVKGRDRRSIWVQSSADLERANQQQLEAMFELAQPSRG